MTSKLFAVIIAIIVSIAIIWLVILFAGPQVVNNLLNALNQSLPY